MFSHDEASRSIRSSSAASVASDKQYPITERVTGRSVVIVDGDPSGGTLECGHVLKAGRVTPMPHTPSEHDADKKFVSPDQVFITDTCPDTVKRVAGKQVRGSSIKGRSLTPFCTTKGALMVKARHSVPSKNMLFSCHHDP
jgi:hypothetical protein